MLIVLQMAYIAAFYINIWTKLTAYNWELILKIELVDYEQRFRMGSKKRGGGHMGQERCRLFIRAKNL